MHWLFHATDRLLRKFHRQAGHAGVADQTPVSEVSRPELPIIGCIDTPVDTIARGLTVTVGGWLAADGPVRDITISLGDSTYGPVERTRLRPDVAVIHSHYGDAGHCGFEFTFNADPSLPDHAVLSVCVAGISPRWGTYSKTYRGGRA